MLKKILSINILFITILCLSGCAYLENQGASLRGSLIGNKFDINYYDNYGNSFLHVKGKNVDIDGIRVKTIGFNSNGDTEIRYELSSAIDITVDGHQLISCGESAVFVDESLKPIKDFELPKEINSQAEAITFVQKNINKIRNTFGKPTIIILCSQMGDAISVYQGDSVNFTFPDDLPKFTKISVDGKPLYLHRFNYFIVDTELIEEE